MAHIRPFRALRPAPSLAAAVASVPYDVLDRAEAAALIQAEPRSFLRVTRADAELPLEVPEHAPEVYARARANLEGLRRDGVLIVDEAPALYVYRLIRGEQRQLGLVGGYSVDEYEDGRIVKHEKTRAAKEEDRIQHILATRAQTGPVFLVHRPDPALDGLLAAQEAAPPLYDFTAVDGIRHTVWRVGEPAAIQAALAALPRLYVADGHHRSAAAASARRRLAEGGALPPEHPAHGFLAVSFPTDQVRILPYHRLLTDLGGRSPAELLAAIGAAVPVSAAPDGVCAAGEARLFLADSGWHRLALPPQGADPVARLAVQALQERVLEPVLGVADPRTDPRLAFVGGIKGPGALERAVRGGQARAAFALPAVTCAELLQVADAGRIMPPKSTWFEPKLRSGLLVYPLEQRS